MVKTFPLQSHRTWENEVEREQSFRWPNPPPVRDKDTEDRAPSWPGAPGSFLGASSQCLQVRLEDPVPSLTLLFVTSCGSLSLLPTTGLQGGGAPVVFHLDAAWRDLQGQTQLAFQVDPPSVTRAVPLASVWTTAQPR